MLTPKPWKPERVIWLFAALLACAALATLAVQGYAWAISPDDTVKSPPNIWIKLTGTFLSHGLSIVLIAVFLRESKITWREAFGFKTERLPRTLLLTLLTTAILLPMALSLSKLSEIVLLKFTGEAAPQAVVVLAQQTTDLSQQIYIAVMAIIFAPIIEEIVFRGILYPAIKQLGYLKIAAWASSILFAWVHFNPLTFVPLIFLGFVMTLLYETTDNLIAPILSHSLFNATNLWLINYLRPQ